MSIPIIPSSMPSFEDSFGPALVGSWLAMGLYGLTTTQAYIYWIHYPKDSAWTKTLVVFLWVLSTVHSVSLSHHTYLHMVKVESDILLAFNNTWSLKATVLLYVRAAMVCRVKLWLIN
ncbi:hypothetical protein SERLADRAFT_445723 [Serpula lacrymans var. lacrymans S7.9]|uniref:Uncharacterized protein n=1 Tax=Serpula lacrymans var. lacrymans (strain S7.9) TaxID=578457 RepID=F8NIR1_SERL9|nr:uncharacterized protein SERLADRAFT_445723 [Serpula lacrymans var. lacrymans S7.9]EGO29976.1 hypothetical protein SERLADRAFT_445723 [Serpula lacrymans var. lacrymans S7.9]